MAMPQRDNFIEQIHRLEGLIAVAEQQKDWAELDGTRPWHMKRQKLSRRPTTRWDELMTVR